MIGAVLVVRSTGEPQKILWAWAKERPTRDGAASMFPMMMILGY